MDTRKNNRGYTELFIRGKHLKLTELKEERLVQGNNKYIFKENMNTVEEPSSPYPIPPYPQPEFHVSHLIHDTNALFEIVQNETGEFRAPEDLLWWSLSVQPEDMQSAEKRLLDRTYPDRTDEQAAGQKPFLQQFATSPAFLDTSRYGSFRVTLTLQEQLLGAYRKQVCADSEPVLRVYETVIYSQEVLYSVLVHSDKHNDLFKEYPLLDDSPDAVCAYRDGQIIWRPEAMCETHSFELVRTPEKQMAAEDCYSWPQFYVWDHVALAFHLPEAQTLNIDTNQIRCKLKFCEPEKSTGNSTRRYMTVTPWDEFHLDFEKAKKQVEECWPDHGPFSKVH